MTFICRIRHIYAKHFKHSSPHVVSAGPDDAGRFLISTENMEVLSCRDNEHTLSQRTLPLNASFSSDQPLNSDVCLVMSPDLRHTKLPL